MRLCIVITACFWPVLRTMPACCSLLAPSCSRYLEQLDGIGESGFTLDAQGPSHEIECSTPGPTCLSFACTAGNVSGVPQADQDSAHCLQALIGSFLWLSSVVRPVPGPLPGACKGVGKQTMCAVEVMPALTDLTITVKRAPSCSTCSASLALSHEPRTLTFSQKSPARIIAHGQVGPVAHPSAGLPAYSRDRVTCRGRRQAPGRARARPGRAQPGRAAPSFVLPGVGLRVPRTFLGLFLDCSRTFSQPLGTCRAPVKTQPPTCWTCCQPCWPTGQLGQHPRPAARYASSPGAPGPGGSDAPRSSSRSCGAACADAD